ncbi:MAG: hypothetical protein LBE09_05970, partial [Christensenellaceae bacterium]|nr:hypothetical protein [Christensenellaceae bacterium]
MKANKKSMLFSTILMVVLLIVAISTASYAWFSTNSSVTVTNTEVTAAKSQSASIAIGWTLAQAESGNVSISFTGVTDDNALEPMMPKNILSNDNLLVEDLFMSSKALPDALNNQAKDPLPKLTFAYKGVGLSDFEDVSAVRIIRLTSS